MEYEFILDLGRRVLLLTLLLSMPLLSVGLIVGVAISILQAVTQIQEMTITFVPKIVAMVLAAILFLPYTMEKITTFAIEMFSPMHIP